MPFNDIEAIKAATSRNTVAVMLEPIQGEGGVNVPDDDYLPAVRAWCDEAGILLLLDEVQTGAGRTGKMFAYQHTASSPTPSPSPRPSARLPDRRVSRQGARARSSPPGEHGTTFGGNALGCEVGYAVLKYMHRATTLRRRSPQRGEYFERRLHALADRQPMVTEVRGKGLIWAIELDRPAVRERS